MQKEDKRKNQRCLYVCSLIPYYSVWIEEDEAMVVGGKQKFEMEK